MTQEELANALGISQSAVSQMLSCTMLISTEMVMKIAIVFGPVSYTHLTLPTNSPV